MFYDFMWRKVFKMQKTPLASILRKRNARRACSLFVVLPLCALALLSSPVTGNADARRVPVGGFGNAPVSITKQHAPAPKHTAQGNPVPKSGSKPAPKPAPKPGPKPGPKPAPKPAPK